MRILNDTVRILDTWGKRLSRDQQYRIANTCALTTFLLLILIGRWDAVLFSSLLNVDEFQAGANALRIIEDGYSWNSVDGNTAGPFHSLLLAWPSLINIDITIQTIRLTALLLTFGTVSLVYGSLSILSNPATAFYLTLPIAIFYSFTRNSDFLHYNSELLPTFLILITLFHTLKLIHTGGLKARHIVFCGLAIGATPFAKAQAAPIALTIGLMLAYEITIRRPVWRKEIVLLSLSSIAPFLALMFPLLLTNSFNDFLISYIEYTRIYRSAPLSLIKLIDLLNQDTLLLTTFALYATIFTLAALMASYRRNLDIKKAKTLIYLSILLAVSLYVVLYPGKPFPHYLAFLIPLLAIISSTAIHYSMPREYAKNSYIMAIFIFSVPALIASTPETRHKYLTEINKYSSPVMRNIYFSSPRVFDWIYGSNNRMLVWGWMPQLYILSGKAPASRESETERQMGDNEYSGYYRRRLLSDYRTSQPDLLVDGTDDTNKRFPERKLYGIHLIPELDATLKKNFTLLNPREHLTGCADIYIKNEIYRTYLEKVIQIKSISGPHKPDAGDQIFSTSKIGDNSVTEDMCVDYWLAPEGSFPRINIKLNSEEPVKHIWILNTKNGNITVNPNDRETKMITLRLEKNGQLVYQRNIKLMHHPYWTKVNLNRTIEASDATIDIISYRGPGAGLNEVKFFR